MTGDLERGYRRLLAAYPAAHRAEYGEEMLGLLLASARPGQRRPRPGDVADLLMSALRARLGRWSRGGIDARWRDAAAVFALLGPVLLAAYHARGPAASLVLPGPWPTDYPSLVAIEIAVPVGWALVAGLLVLGWRRAAAGAAWAAVAAETVVLGSYYTANPSGALHALRPLLLGVVVAAAASVPAVRRRGPALLRWHRLAGLALVAAAVPVATGYVSVRGFDGYQIGLPLLGVYHDPLVVVLGLAALAVAVNAVARLAAPVRRRLLALLVPVVALHLLIRFTFGGFLYSSPRFHPTPVLLVPLQWVGLALTPAVAFGLGVLLLRWHERRLHLIELGRAYEAEGTRATSA